eukprot:Tamp_26687.p1 GENE.Tamp_26687~~Tamp_26687.p1  ORF type:complete len:176 (-),score=51.39 Tamp_26687:359-856(-)
MGSREGGGATGQGATSKNNEDKIKVQETLEDLHEFRDATGCCSSDWLLQVTVKQHDGKDDASGERIAFSKTEKGHDFRRYTVDAGQLIKVTLKNLSLAKDIKLQPVYVTESGAEEPEDMVDLKCGGEEYELPYPLQKNEGDEEDTWAIKDINGKTVLKLRFGVNK